MIKRAKRRRRHVAAVLFIHPDHVEWVTPHAVLYMAEIPGTCRTTERWLIVTTEDGESFLFRRDALRR